MILGTGIDMVEIRRVEDSLARFGERFLHRVFTEGERAYCDERGQGRAQSLALRWAAKEAVSKALGSGIRRGVNFRDIEVTSDRLGRPSIALHGGAARVAKKKGIAAVHLSLTHDGPLAVAFAVAEGQGGAEGKTKAKKGKTRR